MMHGQAIIRQIYLLIKYIKSVLWRVLKRLSYIQDARCLTVNGDSQSPNALSQYKCRLNTFDLSLTRTLSAPISPRPVRLSFGFLNFKVRYQRCVSETRSDRM